MKDTFSPPHYADVVRAIGRVTFREILRDKALYNVLLCAVVLFSIGFLTSRLVGSGQSRVLLDFGISAINLSCAMIAIFTGAGLLGKEFDRRTAQVALSRPITRHQFVAGKAAGLAGVILLNWALLWAVFVIMLLASSPEAGLLNGTIVWAAILLFFQSLILGGIAILVSSLSTTSLSVIITIGFYLIGNNISQLRLVASKMQAGPEATALGGIASLLPNFEYFSLGVKVTYGTSVGIVFGLTSVLYALVLIAFLIWMAGVLIRWREG